MIQIYIFTRKSRKIVVHCQICKIYIFMPYIGIILIVSYFVRGTLFTTIPVARRGKTNP